MSRQTKLIFTLLALSAVMGALFFRQIKINLGIDLTSSDMPLVNPNPIDLPILPSDPVLGNPGSPTTIVVFADLGEKRSKKIISSLYSYTLNRPTQIKVVFKDYPQQKMFFKSSNDVHIAAFCAEKQKKFWPFVNQIAQTSGTATEGQLRTVATAVGLDLPSWDACRAESNSANNLAASMQLGQHLGIYESPALFVNNKQVNMDKKFNIEELLKLLTTP